MNHAALLHHRSRIRSYLTILGVSGALVLSGLLSVSQAGVTPSASGSLGTNVTAGPTYEITGGTRPGGGTNLFHSFGEFSILAGETALFKDPSPPLTTNILGRITGGIRSDIYGTIDTATYYPGANLFLINPAGIVFGATASLNVGGSVYFSTADYLRLDGLAGIFYADPAKPTVLTSEPVVAFGFLTTTPGGITLDGSPLVAMGVDPANPPNLGFVGGQVDIINGAVIQAFGGKILLASAAWSGAGPAAEVTLPTGATAPTITGSATRLPVNINSGSLVDSTDYAGGADLRGGTVYIRGGQLTVDGATVQSQTLGAADGNATGVDIDVASMKVMNGGSILTGTFGDVGKGGAISIIATDTIDTITVSGPGSIITSQSSTAGPAGAITISAPGGTLEVKDSGKIQTYVQGDGPADPLILAADPLTINVRTLNVTNGGLIETRTDAGATGGAISIDATESFTLSGAGTSDVTGIRGISGGGATGTTGSITVTGGAGSITNGAVISSGSEGSSPLGTILVDVTGSLSLSGFNSDATPQPSRIQSISTSNTPAGAITVNAGMLTMTDQALIRSTSGGGGQGGDVTVTASTITLDSLSSITARTQAPGNAGNVTVNTANLMLPNGGTVDTSATPIDGFAGDPSTFVTGNAGTVQVNALGGSLNITGTGSVKSSTTTTGNAGEVHLTGSSVMLDGVSVSTSTSSGGNAGDITATVGNLTLQSGATISSSSTGMNPADPMQVFGNAGTITLNATGTFQSSNSSVTTSVQQGAGTAGTPSNIAITAGGDLNLTGNTSVSTVSDGLQTNAGNITLTAGNSLLLSDSRITADAVNSTFSGNPAYSASGGDIKLTAPNIVNLVNGEIVASVQGNVTTSGGNIDIDPQFVIIQGGSLQATALFGAGGNITIAGNVVLIDPFTLANNISASSQFGVSGSVEVRSPVSNVSGLIGRLPESVLEAQELLRAACAARLAQAQASSFVERGRDSIPAGPDGLLATPFLPPDPTTPQAGASLLEPSGSSRTASPQISDIHARRLLGTDSISPTQLLMDDSACRS